MAGASRIHLMQTTARHCASGAMLQKQEKQGKSITMPHDIKNLRYIVFLIDSKMKDHDGKIFCLLKDAREYAFDIVDGIYADKAVIGMFYLNAEEQEMIITMVQTIGFKGDKKDVNQLELFC